MRRRLPLLSLFVLVCAGVSIGPRVRDVERFWTDRPDALALDLPSEAQAFTFAVFGDRTGGPRAGVAVLRDAVHEVNLLGPDLVMTVGDLIEGYNETPAWLGEMREYKGIMEALDCPWFPVAGNHDVYWRGPEGRRPAGEHEANFEEHFGPLWYAFRHKGSAFIALFSDEGAADGRAKTFNEPASQRMSTAQFSWLDGVLRKVEDARHVFVFLHHPRWLGGNYGEGWERVHARLAAAGNVRAVFAGHIHRMRYDGLRDGIEYFTLATVGGHQGGHVPEAGWLHHYEYVTVREDGFDVVSYPVGSADDPRAISGELADECLRTARALAAGFPAAAAFAPDGGLSDSLAIELTNPSSHTLELALAPRSDDSRWSFEWGAKSLRLDPGESAIVTLGLARRGDELDAEARLPYLDLDALVAVSPELRVPLPRKSQVLPLELAQLSPPAVPADERVLALTGGAHARVPHASLRLPDGPFTVEAFVRAGRFAARQGFLQKTEGAEFGLLLNAGVPSFLVHLDGDYVSARAEDQRLETDAWTHVAGVFDGTELRLYVDGALVAAAAGHGARTTRDVPLVIGGDPSSNGGVVDTLEGAIDEVRISAVARYAGTRFTPARRHESDAETVLLLHMDALHGPWLWDSSPQGAHATWRGQASVSSPAR